MTDRFTAKFERRGANECWPWTAYLNDSGYGLYWNGARLVRAHREAVLRDGRSIPDGLVVDHTCRNRSCVNPKHLRVVTRGCNVHENSDAPAHLNSLKAHCSKGHALTGDNVLRKAHKPFSRYCRTCEQNYWREYSRRKRLDPKDDSASRRDRPNTVNTVRRQSQ